MWSSFVCDRAVCSEIRGSLVDNWLSLMNTRVRTECLLPWQSEREVWGAVCTRTVLWYLPGVGDVINKVVWCLSFSRHLRPCMHAISGPCVCVWVCPSEFIVFTFITVPEAFGVCVCLFASEEGVLVPSQLQPASLRLSLQYSRATQTKQVCLPLRNTNDTPHTQSQWNVD